MRNEMVNNIMIMQQLWAGEMFCCFKLQRSLGGYQFINWPAQVEAN